MNTVGAAVPAAIATGTLAPTTDSPNQPGKDDFEYRF